MNGYNINTASLLTYVSLLNGKIDRKRENGNVSSIFTHCIQLIQTILMLRANR